MGNRKVVICIIMFFVIFIFGIVGPDLSNRDTYMEDKYTTATEVSTSEWDVDTSDIDKKIDVSNVSTVVSLEVDIDDSELQSKVEKAKNKISVPDVRIGTMLDDRNNIQNEVNKLVRETNIPELKVSFASIEEDGEKLQSTIYHIMKEMEVPELEVLFASIDEKELQNKVNEAISKVKVPQLQVEAPVKATTVKEESKPAPAAVKTKEKRKPTLKDKAYDNEITVDTRPVESFDLNYNESQIEKYNKIIEKSRSELRGLRDSLRDIKDSDMGLIDKAKELEKLEELSDKAGKELGAAFGRINMVQSNLPDIDLSEQVEEFMKFKHYLEVIIKSLQKYKKEVKEQIDANLPPNGPGTPGSLGNRERGKGPDELAMTLDDSINEGLEALLNTIYTCLKTISVDVKAIKSMISKTAPKGPTKPTEVSSPVESKEASPIKQISEAKSSEDVQLEKPIIELDEESLRKELEEKLQKSFDFIAKKDIGKGLDVYRKSREMGIVADAPINMNDLAEIGKYIEDLKNKIMSSNLNKAFDINVKDTIKKTKEKDPGRPWPSGVFRVLLTRRGPRQADEPRGVAGSVLFF